MTFLTPLAFALAALLPLVIALYFLKLRREEQPISSTYLWRSLVRDAAANAPWQKLRPNLLLLLQLAFLLALIAALARPFTWSDAITGTHLILVVDTSASMSATDTPPNRLARARDEARRLIQALPGSARVTLIQADATVRVPVSGASDHAAVLAVLDTLRPSVAGADFASALTLATAIAAREPDSEIVILSDGHAGVALDSRTQFIPLGAASDNQAISAFALQSEASGRNLTAFAQATNYGATQVARRLALYADGRLIAARDLTLAPGKPQAITIPGLPEARAYAAQLEGADALAADDRAWAVPPAAAKIAVRLVSSGNRFLETALRLIPNVETTVITPTAHLQTPGAAFQLTVLDTPVFTGTLPSGNLLFIAPLRATEFFSITGVLDAPVPVPALPDDPLLRYVDLREVMIQDAARVALPAWGRAVIVDSRTNAPLLIVGEQDGRRLALVAFDLRRSDLPLRVGFPILIANLLDALTPGGATGIPANVEPGKPLTLATQASALVVRAPNGETRTLTPANGRAVFEQTQQLGVYEIATPDKLLGRFAVNLFDADESDITPRAALPITQAGATAPAESARAKNEWWRALAWIALGVLVGEWLYAYRERLVWLRERVKRATRNVRWL